MNVASAKHLHHVHMQFLLKVGETLEFYSLPYRLLETSVLRFLKVGRARDQALTVAKRRSYIYKCFQFALEDQIH